MWNRQHQPSSKMQATSQTDTTVSDGSQERLLAVIAAVQEELQALGEGLQRRASVAAARSTLELMQDTAHAMSKVRWRCCV